MLVVEIQEKNKVGKSLENSEVNIYTYINSEYIYIYKYIYIYIYCLFFVSIVSGSATFILLISAPVGHIFLVIAIIVISGNGFAKLVVNMVNKKLETKVS